MPTMQFDRTTVAKIDNILERGLCKGVGDRDGQMCVEAAICYALDLPHGDDPGCVSEAVRVFKIRLNDSNWSSSEARAKGLRDLAIAQLGSKGAIDDKEFATRLAEKCIRVILPDLFRRFGDPVLSAAADRCEKEGTSDSAIAARQAARQYRDQQYAAAAYAAAYAYAADADYADVATYAAYAYAAAADAAAKKRWDVPQDHYLLMIARIGLEVLKEMKSPGCELL